VAPGVGELEGEGEAEGESDGVEDGLGESEGEVEGESDGDGEADGEVDGDSEGDGESVGEAVGDSVGDAVGEAEGDSEGVGEAEGDSEGDSDGEGETVGDSDGEAEGEGESDGDTLGDGVAPGRSAKTCTSHTSRVAPSGTLKLSRNRPVVRLSRSMKSSVVYSGLTFSAMVVKAPFSSTSTLKVIGLSLNLMAIAETACTDARSSVRVGFPSPASGPQAEWVLPSVTFETPKN
jgi:hypothetical protein